MGRPQGDLRWGRPGACFQGLQRLAAYGLTVAVAVAVVGSLNMDLTLLVGRLPGPGETVLSTQPGVISPGGKGANQAAAAAAFGAAVRMVGRVGNDDAGRSLVADLAGRGVDVAGVLATDGTRTGGASVAVDPSGENVILVDPGANGLVTAADIDGAGLAGAAAVLVQLEIPQAAVLAALRAASGAAIAILNPAPAAAVSPGLLSLADVLVPNRSELAGMTGAAVPADPGAAARLARTLQADVVVTLGSAGALVVPRAGSAVQVVAPRVATVDATGAGDSFCGALAVSLAQGAELAGAARLAVAAAAISTTALGARGRLASRSEAESLAGDLTVLPIAD
jgi:ribokinase